MAMLSHARCLRASSPIIRRRISTAADPSTRQIFVSKSTSPHFNLSIEDWLLKTAPRDQPALFLYRNAPSVIIGRNQNPWKEVNLAAMQALGFQLVRRRSGGGTVFHDLGNTNFSIHLPRASFDRARTGRVIEHAVRNIMGVYDARTNARNDLCVGDMKVSGSAYKIAGTRAYHHGTMLIATRLDSLGDALRNDKIKMLTKGVASVRSPVCNLRQWKPDASHEQFVQAAVESFRQEFDVEREPAFIDEGDFQDVQQVRQSIDELQTWECVYGQTPEFTHSLAQDFSWGAVTVDIHSKHGVILDASSDACPDLASKLVGRRYGTLDGLDVAALSTQEREVYDWLLRAM
ncbi:Lipoyltransferase and lipoate-protein ligase [Exidia glandulosa HHB12029]|uniref:Putative lipoate-protein ligase A n=1 Tax=Exidia glandulosa HHB12029 TaxID=1314781 RepID=A0A165KW25_EXIGL|nr:Lipoyltransferase and lipoate-protein ligase [Exidia glandulosa HHB12029]